MIALIDGDIVVHRVGYTTENEDLAIAKWRCDEMIDRIADDVGAETLVIFLSDSTENGFRIRIFPEYKANRVAPKPKHYDALKEHVIREWEATITCGQEADDALGIAQDKDMKLGQALIKREGANNLQFKWDNMYSVICSIDKDLKQIPGLHYNFVKKEKTFVRPEEGIKFFYSQILTGDSADNVEGLVGIGPARAAKILEDVFTNKELFTKTREAYEERVGAQFSSDEHALQSLLVNGQVLKIRQQEEEIWNFPIISTEQHPTAEDC